MIAPAFDVRDIDPQLTPVKRYRNHIYQVEKEGQPYILKTPRGFHTRREYFQEFKNELEALRRARGIGGVARLVEHYQKRKVPAILKQFLPGDSLAYTPAEKLSMKMYEDLEQTVSFLHQIGISGIDLHAYNVIISPEGKIGLTDFDLCYILDRKNQKLFDSGKREDENELKEIRECFTQ